MADANINGKGIDILAWKWGENGEVLVPRIAEVKVRQGVPEFTLGRSQDGLQLSENWLKPRLSHIAQEHPDAITRRVANQIIGELKRNPGAVKCELHGIAVSTDRYIIQSVDTAGRVTGVIADGRLSDVFGNLASKAKSKQTRAWAMRHISEFDQIRAAVAEMPAESAEIAAAERQASQRLVEQVRTTKTNALRPRAVRVENAQAGRNFVARLLRQPGVLAAGVTFAVEEAFTGWEYHQGKMSTGDFQRRSGENAVKSAFVGVATQILYILAPTPQGLVVVGVGIVAYVVADQAVSSYTNAVVPKAVSASELEGIVPRRYLETPMIDDVAAGRALIPARR